MIELAKPEGLSGNFHLSQIYFLVDNVENNVMRKRMPRWCVSLRKAPSSVKSAGVHSVLSVSGLVSDLRGGRRKQGSEDPDALFSHLSAS